MALTKAEMAERLYEDVGLNKREAKEFVDAFFDALRDLRVFDRYVGKGVESGFKSLAMALILQEESRTLTDRDVDAVVSAVMAALQQAHGAVIRG